MRHPNAGTPSFKFTFSHFLKFRKCRSGRIEIPSAPGGRESHFDSTYPPVVLKAVRGNHLHHRINPSIRMFETNPDFVFTVTHDFVRSCQNPVLILPDDVPAHPLAPAMECAMLAPKAEVSMFPWKEPKERIPLAVRQIHSFLRAHRPA